MVSQTVYFTVFILASQVYHGIPVPVPGLVRVPEYLSTSTNTSTSTITLELTSAGKERVLEIQDSSTRSMSTPALIIIWKPTWAAKYAKYVINLEF